MTAAVRCYSCKEEKETAEEVIKYKGKFICRHCAQEALARLARALTKQ